MAVQMLEKLLMAEQAWGPTVPWGAVDDEAAGTASGACRTTDGCAVARSDNPITPVSVVASPAGTEGSRVPRRTVRPSAKRARTRGTRKAASTSAAVPVTGTRSPPPVEAPTWSPVEASHVRTDAWSAGVGPNTAPNCPAAR